MKKFTLSIVCLGLFSGLSGCANDQYAIEREYWKVRKQAESIFKNPAAVPPNELDRVVAQLEKFSAKNAQNILATEAEFFVARLYAAKSEFDNSRKQLKKILDKYSKSQVVSSEALFLIGNTYQAQKKWDAALEQYKKVIADYPVTTRGLETPLYIAQYYKANFQPDKMLAAFQEAIEHYRSLAAKYPDSPLAFRAYTLVASCYSATKDWKNALDTFVLMTDKFKGKVKMDAVLLEIALIYKRELKDEIKSRETLERLIKEYPQSRYLAAAEKLLKG